jgi:hypothetical protein
MRRALVLPLIALVFALPAGWAFAAGDAKGPPCSNIIEADFSYNGNPADPSTGTTATLIIHLDVASCTRLMYRLVVLDDLATKASVTDAEVPGDGDLDLVGEDFVEIQATVPADQRDGNVCVYATTTDGRREIDRAPDVNVIPNCIELIPGGTGGGSGFG